jgi:hypothetical protein
MLLSSLLLTPILGVLAILINKDIRLLKSLSILAMSSIMSTTDFDTLFKGNFIYVTQLFLFYGIFIAFAVKTPTIFLNTWLSKVHVESHLGVYWIMFTFSVLNLTKREFTILFLFLVKTIISRLTIFMVKGREILLANHYLWVILSNNLCSNYKVEPHRFTSEQLLSDTSISEVITQIDTFLPQLATFINQFSTTVNQSGISVVTDTAGTMSIDVPQDMSEQVANKLSNKIGVIDRLITTRSQDISDLLQKGTILEEKLKVTDSQYVSQLTDRMKEYKRLISLYKHS